MALASNPQAIGEQRRWSSMDCSMGKELEVLHNGEGQAMDGSQRSLHGSEMQLDDSDSDVDIENWRQGNDGVEDEPESECGDRFEAGDIISAGEEEGAARVLDSGFVDGQEPTDAERGILQGQTFASWEEFDRALDDYEAKSGWRINREKRDKTRFIGKCRGWCREDDTSCKAELTARCMKKTGLVSIRKVFLTHTCPLGLHKFRNGSHKVRWVARQLLRHVKINPAASVNQLNDNLRNFYDSSSKPWTIQRARAACRELVLGCSKESFQKIPAYTVALQKADPNVHVFWQGGAERRFARLYVCPSSCQHVYPFCRPLVGLDGAHTTGKYPMVVLFATCYDGENQIVILAWAIVLVENTDNWTWFLEHLQKSYPKMYNEQNTVFISDQDKGLKQAVAEVFPNQNHSLCVQHLKANIKSVTDVHCQSFFGKVADAKTEQEFEELLKSFQPITERQKALIPYIQKINPNLYARHTFAVPRYGHNSSSIVEVINATLKPCRVLPALMLSDYIWCYVMEKHYERSEHAKQLGNADFDLTEHASILYNQLYQESKSVKERPSSMVGALMIDGKGSYALRIEERHCDCTDWAEMDFPCAHAIRFLTERGENPRLYVGKMWLASTQKLAYQVPVPPVSIDRLAVAAFCFEPIIDPKEKKRKQARCDLSWGQQTARGNEREVWLQSHRCSRCKEPGHNKRKCPSFPTGGVDDNKGASHSTLNVGAELMIVRREEADPWQVFHTSPSPSTHSFSQWLSEINESQTGPSQVTS